MVGYETERKKRKHITLKTASGESKSVAPEMVVGWRETSLPTPLSSYELKVFKTLTNLDYSMNSFQIKPIILSMESALAEG